MLSVCLISPEPEDWQGADWQPNRKLVWVEAQVVHLALLSAALLFVSASSRSRPATETGRRIPILLYHRFGPVASDGMTVTTAVFASQLRLIRAGGYTVIPLSQLVAYLQGQAPAPAPRAVVITADDGHRSIYTVMAPLVKSYGLPVTGRLQ